MKKDMIDWQIGLLTGSQNLFFLYALLAYGLLM